MPPYLMGSSGKRNDCEQTEIAIKGGSVGGYFVQKSYGSLTIYGDGYFLNVFGIPADQCKIFFMDALVFQLYTQIS